MIAGKYELFFSFFHPYLDSHIKALMPLRVKSNRYHEQAERTAAGFVERLQEMALAMPQMCCALYLQALAHPRQVTCQSVCSDKPVFLTPFVSQEKNPDVAHSAAFTCTHHPRSIVMAFGIQLIISMCALRHVCSVVCQMYVDIFLFSV